ncbi:unnamed protein product, partial [Tilletia caries]
MAPKGSDAASSTPVADTAASSSATLASPATAQSSSVPSDDSGLSAKASLHSATAPKKTSRAASGSRSQPSGPEPTTAGGPSPHTDATAPLSSTGQDTVAASHSQDSASLASRARTPEPVSMDAFLQAFQRLSPSKQQQFFESP